MIHTSKQLKDKVRNVSKGDIVGIRKTIEMLKTDFCNNNTKTPSFFVIKLEYIPHFLYTIGTGGL